MNPTRNDPTPDPHRAAKPGVQRPDSPDANRAAMSVRRAVDTLDGPRESMRAELLRRIGQRIPAELKAAYELVWMRRVSGVAAALFLALFAAERFDVGEPSGSPARIAPVAADPEAPVPAWLAMEQERRDAEDGAWLMDELLIGGMDE